MTMSIKPEIRGIPDLDGAANKIETNQSVLYVFRVGSPISQNPRVSLDVKSNTLFVQISTTNEVSH